MNPPPETTPNDWDPYDKYEDNDEIARLLPEMEETVDANGTLIDQQLAYNKIINAQVQLHHQDHITKGKVKMGVLGPDGRIAGSYHDKPMLNSTVYENTTVHMKDKYVMTYSNQRRLRNSTAGWKLQILWKDKSESW
eukprot:4055468-Ditylum_brightwellii.AAC.1